MIISFVSLLIRWAQVSLMLGTLEGTKDQDRNREDRVFAITALTAP